MEIRQIRIRRLGFRRPDWIRGRLALSNGIIRRPADAESALIRRGLVVDGEPWVPTWDFGRVVAFRCARRLQGDFTVEPAWGRLEIYVCAGAFVAPGQVEGGVELFGGGDERGGSESAGAVVHGAFSVSKAAKREGANAGGSGRLGRCEEGCGRWEEIGRGGASDAERGVMVESVDDVVLEVDVIVDGLVGVEDAAIGGFVGEL